MSRVSDILSSFCELQYFIANLSFSVQFWHHRFFSQIDYSEKYQDGKYEYRHVILTKEMAKNLPKNRTLSETEWRSIGVQQSRGWDHYACHRPEPHILLFRRPLGTVSHMKASLIIYISLNFQLRRDTRLAAPNTLCSSADTYSTNMSKQQLVTTYIIYLSAIQLSCLVTAPSHNQ